MLILELFIALLYCGFACAASPCLSESPCRCVLSNNSVIDLSSVGSPEFVRFYDIAFDTNCTTTLYSYNPCYAFDSPDRQTTTNPGNTLCSGASACVKTPGGVQGQFPEVHAIGLQKNAAFSINDSHIIISYSDPNSKWSLEVVLNCNDDDSRHVLSLDSLECPTEDKPIVFTLTSKCACPDGCKSADPTSSSSSGLSTGSKLLIAFFTILIAYLLVGVVWNFCNGSHGLQLIPNIEFWNDLPTLITEGIAYTCSCCGRTSSYGEV